MIKVAFVAQKRTAPLSVRLSPELNQRLEDSAKALHMKKHTLAQEAIEAAVDAIEKNDFRLVVPMRFEVTHVPQERPKIISRYPEDPQKTAATAMNEPGSNSPATSPDLEDQLIEKLGGKVPAPKKGGARQK